MSSTDVTPETAVPVYVERGKRSATVFFAEGDSEEVPPETALEMASQRYLDRRSKRQEAKQPPAVVRVIQRVEADLLRPGIRLIDTPGLSDPSMSEVFEQLTLSELDRTAAAIIVFLYPPGIASNEITLLRSLGARRVDKTFLVCNFYSGPWEDGSIRTKVEGSIREAIARGTDTSDDDIDSDTVRLYSVNAGAAWQARRTGDAAAYESSGVAQLVRDVEEYLSEGALSVLTSSAGRHGHSASSYYPRKWKIDLSVPYQFSLSIPDHLKDNIREQSAKWNSLDGELSLYADGTAQGVGYGNCVELTYQENFLYWADIDGPGGTLAREYTCHFLESDPDRIRVSSIQYDREENWHYGTDASGSNEISFRGVALHEFGHMSGWVGHFSASSDECSGSGPYHTMCANPNQSGDGWKSLEQHDKHTFNAAYPGSGGPTLVGDGALSRRDQK